MTRISRLNSHRTHDGSTLAFIEPGVVRRMIAVSIGIVVAAALTAVSLSARPSVEAPRVAATAANDHVIKTVVFSSPRGPAGLGALEATSVYGRL